MAIADSGSGVRVGATRVGVGERLGAAVGVRVRGGFSVAVAVKGSVVAGTDGVAGAALQAASPNRQTVMAER